jgi:putative ABC transport system substrate-binding protein
MDRRTFLGTVAAGILVAPAAAGAQQPGTVWRVGLLFPASRAVVGRAAWQSFVQQLYDLGYVEGRNLIFEYGTAAVGTAGEPSDLARAFARQKVDLIVTFGASGAKAAQEASRTIPIVVLAVFDAPESGLVASLARPRGNITGISLPYRDVAATRLELLKAALPKLTRVAFLTTGSRGAEVEAARAMEAAADLLGLKLATYEINIERPRDVDRAFAGMKTARVEAVAVSEPASCRANSRESRA